LLIDSKGIVVTHCWPLMWAYSKQLKELKIEVNKKEYRAKEIIHYDVENNILILKIDGKDFKKFPAANSNDIKSGNKVYFFDRIRALIEGAQRAFRETVVTRVYKNRGLRYFELADHVSPTALGGPLINDKGVIGIIIFTHSEIYYPEDKRPLDIALDINALKPFLDIPSKGTLQEVAEGMPQEEVASLEANRVRVSEDF